MIVVTTDEIEEYTRLLAEASEEALRRTTSRAEEMDANAIASTRFITSAIMGEASEIPAYATTVVIEQG